jgi:hypothetical protein
MFVVVVVVVDFVDLINCSTSDDLLPLSSEINSNELNGGATYMHILTQYNETSLT